MHVQTCNVETVRQAIKNGRKLEETILDEGIAHYTLPLFHPHLISTRPNE